MVQLSNHKAALRHSDANDYVAWLHREMDFGSFNPDVPDTVILIEKGWNCLAAAIMEMRETVAAHGLAIPESGSEMAFGMVVHRLKRFLHEEDSLKRMHDC
ncbi:hypothetical protein HDU88_002802 [Geranomyces variabilis]|nr:hypothetical protein HDU88_002802 [Geranomyces variabilis]